MRVVDAHAGQEYKWRALRLKQGRDVEAVVLRTPQLQIKHRDVDLWMAPDKLNSFGRRGDACHMRRTGPFQDLLNVEGDQEFVVQH